MATRTRTALLDIEPSATSHWLSALSMMSRIDTLVLSFSCLSNHQHSS